MGRDIVLLFSHFPNDHIGAAHQGISRRPAPSRRRDPPVNDWRGRDASCGHHGFRVSDQLAIVERGRRLSMKRFKWLPLLAAVGLLATACGGGSSNKTVAGKLVIDNESGSTWTCQFNPFNPAVVITSFAFVYEPLQYVNILQSTKKPVPWLTTSSSWSNGFKTLTFTIRKGVTWSDGKPFSAADVA